MSFSDPKLGFTLYFTIRTDSPMSKQHGAAEARKFTIVSSRSAQFLTIFIGRAHNPEDPGYVNAFQTVT